MHNLKKALCGFAAILSLFAALGTPLFTSHAAGSVSLGQIEVVDKGGQVFALQTTITNETSLPIFDLQYSSVVDLATNRVGYRLSETSRADIPLLAPAETTTISAEVTIPNVDADQVLAGISVYSTSLLPVASQYRDLRPFVERANAQYTIDNEAVAIQVGAATYVRQDAIPLKVGENTVTLSAPASVTTGVGSAKMFVDGKEVYTADSVVISDSSVRVQFTTLEQGSGRYNAIVVLYDANGNVVSSGIRLQFEVEGVWSNVGAATFGDIQRGILSDRLPVTINFTGRDLANSQYYLSVAGTDNKQRIAITQPKDSIYATAQVDATVRKSFEAQEKSTILISDAQGNVVSEYLVSYSGTPRARYAQLLVGISLALIVGIVGIIVIFRKRLGMGLFLLAVSGGVLTAFLQSPSALAAPRWYPNVISECIEEDVDGRVYGGTAMQANYSDLSASSQFSDMAVASVSPTRIQGEYREYSGAPDVNANWLKCPQSTTGKPRECVAEQADRERAIEGIPPKKDRALYFADTTVTVSHVVLTEATPYRYARLFADINEVSPVTAPGTEPSESAFTCQDTTVSEGATSIATCGGWGSGSVNFTVSDRLGHISSVGGTLQSEYEAYIPSETVQLEICNENVQCTAYWLYWPGSCLCGLDWEWVVDGNGSFTGRGQCVDAIFRSTQTGTDGGTTTQGGTQGGIQGGITSIQTIQTVGTVSSTQTTGTSQTISTTGSTQTTSTISTTQTTSTISTTGTSPQTNPQGNPGTDSGTDSATDPDSGTDSTGTNTSTTNSTQTTISATQTNQSPVTNPPDATVSGVVFTDSNADGAQQLPLETGWPSREVCSLPAGLFSALGASVGCAQATAGARTAVTNGSGQYTITIPYQFTGQAYVTLHRTPILGGWQYTLPANGQHAPELVVSGGAYIKNFGARPIPATQAATISGTVFNDLNADGIRQPGENGLATTATGTPIVVRAATTSGVVVASQTVSSLSAGTYSLTIPAGSVGQQLIVSQVTQLPATWEFTLPSLGVHAAELVASAGVYTKNFGQRLRPVTSSPATISGVAFEDLDRDGVIDTNENLRYQGWLVSATRASDNTVVGSATTGVDGSYTLQVPAAEVGQLIATSIEQRPNYVATLPALGAHAAEYVTSGGAYVKDFGMGAAPQILSFAIDDRLNLDQSGNTTGNTEARWSGVSASNATLSAITCTLSKANPVDQGLITAPAGSVSYTNGQAGQPVSIFFTEAELTSQAAVSFSLSCTSPFGTVSRTAVANFARGTGSTNQTTSTTGSTQTTSTTGSTQTTSTTGSIQTTSTTASTQSTQTTNGNPPRVTTFCGGD